MKREYVKPAIYFESFVLSTNIAGDCDVDTNLPSNKTCGMEVEGVGIVFLTNMDGCSFKVTANDGDGNWGTICYDVPTGENLFNS